jgi:predicted RNase H-like HicB family nuclease
MKNNKTITIQEYDLPVTLHEEEEGFLATCPIWPDCYAQGDSIEEAINEIASVASSLIELYKEEDMPIPLKLKSTTQKQPHEFTVSFPVIVSSS